MELRCWSAFVVFFSSVAHLLSAPKKQKEINVLPKKTKKNKKQKSKNAKKKTIHNSKENTNL
jgi:mannitol-specific phosphotransferase system IIBC component